MPPAPAPVPEGEKGTRRRENREDEALPPGREAVLIELEAKLSVRYRDRS